MSDLNLPYEPQDETHLTDNFLVTGGVVVMAASTDNGDAALVLRFAHADGSGFAPPVLLVMSDTELEALPDLVTNAVNDAITAARTKR